jgi:uncharacterized membrane protein
MTTGDNVQAAPRVGEPRASEPRAGEPRAGEPRASGRRSRERALDWFTRHWLAVFNLVIALYVGLPFLAPLLMNAGLTLPGDLIYKAYYPVCHQFPYRSWFIGGPQLTYSRAEFERLTGIDTLSLGGQLESKNFQGSPQMGYKVAFCQRDVGIYSGLLIGALLFGLVRTRARPVHWLVWAVVGVGPIALDGFSQLFSQVPGLFGVPNPLWQPDAVFWRESTPLLRTLTGGLFGFMLVWLAYPYIEDSMLDTRGELRRLRQ